MSLRSATSVTLAAGLAACGLILGVVGAARAQSPVEFEGETDVGDVAQKGSSRFDAARNEFHVVGGGSNMWDDRDAFHFVWRPVSGDLILSAEIRFAETSGDAHRKGGWIVRQGLEADAPYADAIVHADGLISLQYRLAKGGETLEIQSPFKAPAAVRLERTGDLFTLFVAPAGRSFRPVGSVVVPMNDPVYAGLGMCSHAAARTATGVFSNLGFANPGVVPPDQRVLESSLEVVNVDSAEREAVYVTRDHIEAPNWSRDGRSFLFNSAGRLYELPRSGGKPRLFDTGFANRLNNDHGLSFDGRWLAISHEPEEESLVYIVPAAGGTPRQVTALGPSYWHGWSPDGKTLVYCAERNDEYDVYAIAADAQKSTDEQRLTSAPGLDDGPDFSPDGKTVYFNSVRTGHMRIWRMNPDGSDQRQLTFDEAYGDWFPHPSPDGKWIVFLSFDSSVEGHPPNKEVALRIMPAAGGEPRTLARLFGGQGTINVPSWSPDSTSVAFVSYRLVKP